MQKRELGRVGLSLTLAVLLAGISMGMGPSPPGAVSSIQALGSLPTYRTIYYNSSIDGTSLSYLEWQPAHFNASKSYPLAVFLHGLGYDATELLQLNGGLGAIATASQLGFLLISLNTRTPAGFYVNSPYTGPQEQDVLDAISHEESIRTVNSSDVYLFGSSMGTIGAYSIAAHHSGLVRGIGAVAECPETFMAVYYHYLIGQPQSFATTTGGYLPNQSAQALAETYYLDSARYYPQNFSHVLLYAVQGGDDNRCPNNPHYFGYLQSNNTFLNSTCLVLSNWSQPANCQVPFDVLNLENPGQYLWRFVYEPTGDHTLNDLYAPDMFQFWLGNESIGLYCASPGFPPAGCVGRPTVGAPLATPGVVDVNASTELTVTAYGGSPPYTFRWLGLPPGCSSQDTPTLSCQPQTEGTYNVSVDVTDSNRSAASSPRTGLVVHPALRVLSSAAPLLGPVPLTVNFSVEMTGGTTPFTLDWSFGDGAGSTLASPTHTYLGAGSYEAQLWANDSGGGSYHASYAIVAQGGPLTVAALASSAPSIDVGQSVEFSVQALGGAPPYSYAWSGLPAACPSVDASRLSCVPSEPAGFTVTVVVTDSLGAHMTSPPLAFRVDPAMVVPTLTLSRSAIDLGQEVSVTVAVSGGLPPYAALWTGLPPGCAGGSADGLTCIPTDVGQFGLQANVTDSNAATVASAAVSLTVNPDPTLSDVSSTPDPAQAGDPWLFSVAPHGGTLPYTFRYTGLPPGCSSFNASIVACTPTTSGTYAITVNLTDSVGVSAFASYTLVVGAGPSEGGLPDAFSDVSPLAWVGVALAAGAGVAVYWWLRRRPPAP